MLLFAGFEVSIHDYEGYLSESPGLDHDDPHLDGDEEVRGDESARPQGRRPRSKSTTDLTTRLVQRKTWGGAVKDAER